MVGYVPGRKNSISLGKACWTLGIAMHEILHSLGMCWWVLISSEKDDDDHKNNSKNNSNSY